MSAGLLAGRTVLVVLGSGATGAYVFENKQWIQSLLKGWTEFGKGIPEMEMIQKLSQNVETLSQTVQSPGAGAMVSVPPPMVKIVNGRDGGSLDVTTIVVGVSLISVASLLLYWKGRRLAGNLWVSRNMLSETVERVQGSVKQVSDSLQTVNMDLKGRIMMMEDKVSINADHIQEKVDEELTHTKKRINVVGMSVENVQGVVDGMQNRIEDLQNKLTYANKGILLLCSIVGSIPQQERRTVRLWSELRKFVGSRAEDMGIEMPSKAVPALEPSNPVLSSKSRSLNCNLFLKDTMRYNGVSVRSFEKTSSEEPTTPGGSPPDLSDKRSLSATGIKFNL